jgi:hypothetical protein
MKALSGYAEWFWLIAKNWKDVENRPWPLTYKIRRELLPYRFYLHASKTKTPHDEINFIISHLSSEQLGEFMNIDWSKYRGAIIGEATAVDEIRPGHVRMTPPSIWQFGPYSFLVRDGVLFEAPVPYRGQLGFFEVNLPEGTNVNSK